MENAPLLTIRQIRAIDGVAADASLARASERLSTSQSSLSRYIAGAERALGHSLFQRGWTGMDATSAGAIVIAHCHRMVATIEAAQAALEASGARVAVLGHHLTWELLSVVHAVRATGTVSAAARHLQTSQPNVSRLLGKIAAAVGRPVFRRGRTGVEPTEDARILCGLHDRLLMDVVSLPALLDALSGEVTGRVAVGLLPFSEQDAVIKTFGEIMRRHRHVRLQAVTGSYAALIDGLRQNELDFVVGVLRKPASFESLCELQLYDESFAVVARAGHPLSRGKPALERLVQENWMVAPHGTPTRRYFEDWLVDEGLTPPRQTCEIVTFHLAEQMILHSDAIGLLTYSDRKRKSLQPGLRILPIRLHDSRRAIGLTYSRSRRLSTAQKTFMDILAETWKR